MNEGGTIKQKVWKEDATKEPNQYFIEEKTTKTRTCFLSEKRWKKVAGTKTERTKDGRQGLGGMEWFLKKIRYGRRDSEEPQFHSGVSAAGFVLLRHYKERSTWLRISPIVAGALHMFYLAALLRLGSSRTDVCLFCSPLCARGRACRATSP